MDPVTLAIGSIAVGSIAKASAAREEGKARSAQLKQEAIRVQEDAQNLRMESESTLFDAEALRVQAGQVFAGADADDYNAALNDQSAAQIRAATAENARRLRIKQTKERGSIAAQLGASGLSFSGSALDVLEEAAATQALDALTVEHEGELSALAQDNAARLTRTRAANARISGRSILARAGYVERKAGFINEQADDIAAQGDFYREQARRAKKTGNLNAVAELAGGARQGMTLFGR